MTTVFFVTVTFLLSFSNQYHQVTATAAFLPSFLNHRFFAVTSSSSSSSSLSRSLRQQERAQRRLTRLIRRQRPSIFHPLKYSESCNVTEIHSTTDDLYIPQPQQHNNEEGKVLPIPTTTVTAKATPVDMIADTKLPTDMGQYRLRAYRIREGYTSSNEHIGNEPVVIYYVGDENNDDDHLGQTQTQSQTQQYNVPVRVHDSCMTSEIFRSQRCDCKDQLIMSFDYIKKYGGYIIYLQQEGRGIGLANKIRAHSIQDQYNDANTNTNTTTKTILMDTYDANIQIGMPIDCREYNVIPNILAELNVSSIQLLTNNPNKINKLQLLGINITNTIPIVIPQNKMNQYNTPYLQSKYNKMKHKNLGRVLNNIATTTTTSLSSSSSSSSSSSTTTSTTTRIPFLPLITTSNNDIVNGDSSSSNNKNNNVNLIPRKNTKNTTITSSRKGIYSEKQSEKSSDIIIPTTTTTTTNTKNDNYHFGKTSVINAIQAIARNEMIMVVDNNNKNPASGSGSSSSVFLVMAAENCTDLNMAWMIRYSSGVVYVTIPEQRADQLNLHSMIKEQTMEENDNNDGDSSATIMNSQYTVTVDATSYHGISTGISATDRATTARLLANPQSNCNDFHRPGHIAPIRIPVRSTNNNNENNDDIVAGSVPEVSTNLLLSNMVQELQISSPCAVLCEIVSENNPTQMMTYDNYNNDENDEVQQFAKRNNLILTSIQDIIQYYDKHHHHHPMNKNIKTN